jgi:hypothetical protein
MDPSQPGMPPNAMGQPGGLQAGLPAMPGVPGQNGQTGFPPGMPGVPGQTSQTGFPPGIPGMPAQSMPGQTPGQNSSSNQGSYSTVGNYGSTVGTGGVVGSAPSAPGGMPQQFPGMPGPPANSQNFGGTPAYPIAQGANGMPPNYPQPGMQINPAQQSAAQNLIGSLLTTPRPGGLQALGQAQTTIGGGIAGVASKMDADSIMVYRDRTNYAEWEFIFDPSKQRFPPPNPVNGAGIGTPAAQLGSMPTGNMGIPAAQLGTPAGATPGMQGMPGTGIMGGAGTMGTAGMGATGTAGAPMGGMGATNMQPDIRPGRP